MEFQSLAKHLLGFLEPPLPQKYHPQVVVRSCGLRPDLDGLLMHGHRFVGLAQAMTGSQKDSQNHFWDDHPFYVPFSLFPASQTNHAAHLEIDDRIFLIPGNKLGR